MEHTLDSVRDTVISVLRDITKQWQIDDLPINGSTLMSGDLGLTSLDALNFMAGLDISLGVKLPYDQLIMRDGEYIRDLTVNQLAEFALPFLNGEAAAV